MVTSSKKLEYDRKYRKEHREKYREHVQNWRNAHRSRSREINENARLVRAYGITLKDYDRMFEEQGGRCAICKTSNAENKRNLHVDHNHSNGKIRGLLCIRCNSGLGYFRESPELFDSAKEYLSKFR